MRKTAFTLIALVSLSVVATAQRLTLNKAEQPAAATTKPATVTDGPQIKFESETIDYGDIIKGANGVRQFVFTNTGKTDLLITNAQGSCGCTVPTFPKEAIKPGEKGKIEVKYDTQRQGAFTKYVTITTNIGDKETKTLTIKGNVMLEPEAVPQKETSLFGTQN